jgi:predicted SprT family Zn-dependent metalloprotease
MQTDFFAKLISWTRPAQPAPPAPNGDDAALTAQARELLRALGCEELAASVRVRWNPRMSTTAGLAVYQHCLVTLNPKLSQFGAAEMDKTLRHELAHLLARHRAGRRRIAPHGAEWKRACADLGLPGEKRCHDLPLPRRKVLARHIYRCPVCKQDIRRVRPFHRRVACLDCCRAHNRGRYHDRFRLVKVPAPPDDHRG